LLGLGGAAGTRYGQKDGLITLWERRQRLLEKDRRKRS